MRRIGDVRPGALLEEVGLSNHFQVVELLVKRRGGSITMQYLGGKSGSLMRRSVLG